MKRLRHFIVSILCMGLGVIFMHLFAPILLTSESESLHPIVQSGDILLVSRIRKPVPVGSVVLARDPAEVLRYPRIFPYIKKTVLRVLVAVEGDSVSWNNTELLVRNGEESRTYTLPLLSTVIHSSTNTQTLKKDEVFLLSLRSGRFDARIIGPYSTKAMLYRVIAIVAPAHRRRRLHGLDST